MTPELAKTHIDFGLVMEVGGTALISILLHVVAFRRRRERPDAAAVLFGVAILMAIFAGVLAGTATDRASRWRWLLSSLPAIILIGHAGFLHYVRGKLVLVDTPENRARALEILNNVKDASITYRRTIEAGERYFSLEGLVLRYVLPALFVFGITYGLSNALFRWYVFNHYFACAGTSMKGACQLFQAIVSGPGGISSHEITPFPNATMLGASVGLAGAYVYVMLYLGQRAFRLDITPGAASWCAITLAIGPVLAGVLGPYVLSEDAGATIKTGLERVSVLFVAGFSPKFIVSGLEQLARRVFGDDSRSMPARTLPLNQIRGITRDVQERLAEEGLDDVNQLAMADPYRLLRNTSFDKRLILSWIDNALLLKYLPESYASLERRGIPGAMSLVWYTRGDRKAELDKVAASAAVSPDILWQTAQRMAEDRQVQQVQVLYYLNAEGALNQEDPIASGSNREAA